MKVIQLIFLLGLYIHWVNCFWYFVAKADNNWFPPKDQDFRETIAYSGHRLDRYILFYYYATLSLVGSEILPTEFIELISAILLVFVGSIVVGLTIGEFSSIMEAYTARNRAKNEEHDIISSTMLSLRLPEDIQSRVLNYYEELTKGADDPSMRELVDRLAWALDRLYDVKYGLCDKNEALKRWNEIFNTDFFNQFIEEDKEEGSSKLNVLVNSTKQTAPKQWAIY